MLVEFFLTGRLSCFKAEIRSFATPRQRSEVESCTEPVEKLTPRAISFSLSHADMTMLNVIKCLWEMMLAVKAAI